MKQTTLLLISLFCLLLTSKAQSLTDIDGNIYPIITIGSQTWMAENLKTTRFSNGDSIPTTPLDINNHSSSIYQWAYDLDSSLVEQYGHLYTWYVATDSRNVCPTHWKVPDNDDWETLRDFLGGETIAGAKMKEEGTMHWLETDSTVDNSSGFTGRGAGFRGNPSSFRHLNSLGTFWSTTPVGNNNSFPRGYDFSMSASNHAFATSVAEAILRQYPPH